MRLFDYALKNAAPIRLALDSNVVQGARICSSSATTPGCAWRDRSGCSDERIALQASGDANLGILQGFFRDVRGSGRAELTAAIDGPLRRAACSPAARRSPTAASAISRCRTRSTPSTARCSSMPRGIRLDDVDGDDGRRTGAVRRTRRLRWLPAGRAERHRARRGHAPAVSRRRAVHGRRRPVHAREREGADARRDGHGEERDLDPTHRRAGQHLRLRRAAPRPRAPRRTAAPAAAGGAAAVRHRGARALDAARGNNLVRLVASADLSCAAPTIGRCSSGTPTSSAAK